MVDIPLKSNQTKPSIPLLREGCDPWPNFKWSTAGLNSEFSFSLSGCLGKAKKTQFGPAIITVNGRCEEKNSCLS